MPQAAPTAPGPAPQAAFQPPLVIFQPPDISSGAPRKPAPADAPSTEPDSAAEARPAGGEPEGDSEGGAQGTAKRRRRGGRGHSKGRGAEAGPGDGAEPGAEAAPDSEAAPSGSSSSEAAAEDSDGDSTDASGRRRRRRRRTGHSGDADGPAADDPPNTVVHVRPPRGTGDDGGGDVRGVKGSTRLEAKRQRRREGRESGRRRPPIITESEFLARREAVERVMVVRQRGDRTQIAVLEDGVLVEHYVDKASHQSYVGNVYLGRVQNVLPSMEAAFVDIGKGRNAVLYA
ncbi:MAG TPA: ribonuclease E/G, partial [Streptosporangiaceae bacterium]|nr:ribonuclease E/G [Streptosporangiaceae bacterium]